MPGQHNQPSLTFGSRVYASLRVIYHLHFWQNNGGLLRATAVTRGGTAPSRSRHRKSTQEKKIPAKILTRNLLVTSPSLYQQHPAPAIGVE